MALPIIHGTAQATYPVRMTYSCLTGVSAWQSGAEQRWIRRPSAIVTVELLYAKLLQAQKDSVKAAITSAKGRFDQTLALVVPFGFFPYVATLSNFGIASDEWTATESKTTQYNAPLKLTQSMTQPLTSTTPGQPFPRIATPVDTALSMLPYTQKKRFQTVLQRVEAGATYTYPEFAGGLTGYPTGGLMAWELVYNKLTRENTALLVDHFLCNYGRAYSFTFTDEDATAYSKTHYASDDLTVTFNDYDDASITIKLEATF